jgi:DNA-binding CsgD family transcriptional regulator
MSHSQKRQLSLIMTLAMHRLSFSRAPDPLKPAVSLGAGDAEGSPSEGPPHELILDGRRYRLVPIVDQPADAPAPHGDEAGIAVDRLTPRELQVVELVAQGLSNKEIAGALRISGWTVSTHLRRIFAKLQVATRAAMVHRWTAALPTRRSAP